MLPNRTSALENAPLKDLLAIVLRQFKRPLKAGGIDLTDADIERLVESAVERGERNERMGAVSAALLDLVTESEAVLGKWNLSFRESIDTLMEAIPGWASTVEFLEIATEKANAELRISAGSALLAAFGDLSRADHLLVLTKKSRQPASADLDTVLARRVLLFAAGIDAKDPLWWDKLQAWAKARAG